MSKAFLRSIKTPAVNSFLSKWIWIFSFMDISVLLVEVFKQKTELKSIENVKLF